MTTLFSEIRLNQTIKNSISAILEMFKFWIDSLINSIEIEHNRVYAWEYHVKFENKLIKYRIEIEVKQENKNG